MFDPKTSIDNLRGIERDAEKSDVVNLIGSFNGKTRKIQPDQLKNLLGGGGGTPIEGDFVSKDSLAVPNGVATLNQNGFVPSDQLNIGSSSGPFIVKPWDVKNVKLVQIEPIPTNNIELTIQQLITNIKYKKTKPEDVLLKNTFFKSSDNIDYVDGRIKYTGVVKPTTSNIPYPSIGFNNVGDFSFQFSLDNTAYASDIAIVITREVELEKALIPTATTPASVTLSINGSTAYIGNRTFELNDKDIISVYRQGNVFNITAGSNNHSIDISEQNLPNPDLVWNVFVALGGQANPETNEYDKDYSILMSNILDNRLGGCIYHDLPDKFKVKLQPIVADDPYNYVFCFAENVSSKISDLITQTATLLFFSATQNVVNVQLQDGTSASLPYQPNQIFEFEVDTINRVLKIAGATYTYSSNLNWKTFASFFFNGGGTVIETRPADFSYELIDFVIEKISPAEVPTGSKDGEVFKIINDGLFNGKELKENDYAILFNGLSDVIVTRLPPDLDEEKIETLLDFKLAAIQVENKEYTDSKFNSIKMNYRGKFVNQNNIYVESPKEGDYVFVTNGGTDIIPYYFNNNVWSLSSPATNLNADAIAEGAINKFFNTTNINNYLVMYRYLNTDNITSLMENHWFSPAGYFESNQNKIDEKLKDFQGNKTRYPSANAVIEFVDEKLSQLSTYYIEAKTDIIVTSKKSRFNSSDDSFYLTDDTTVAGNTEGKIILKRAEGEVYDPAFPNVPANWLINSTDGFILDIAFRLNNGISNTIDLLTGVSYVGSAETPSENSFIGIRYKDGDATWRIVGTSPVNGNQIVKDGFLSLSNTTNIRFVLKDDILKVYKIGDDASINLLETIPSFSYNYTGGQRPGNIILFNELKTGGDYVSKISASYKTLVKV